MHKMRDKVVAQFPIVLLTLVSIIQALALELMWGKITAADYLWQFSLDTIVTWGMISATLMGILQLWITYSTLVIGFTWRPDISDSILPFVIGLLEFLMINLIDATVNPFWFYVLALLFVITNWVVHTTLRRARRELENEAFFRNRAPATWWDFRGAMVTIVLFVLFGMSITVFNSLTWLALLGIATANVVLVVQMSISSRLWNAMMEVEE
ncbi:MAG: hypothetical protein GKR91_04795 [Pseudomonadales bacterium]|nr:hypothetical protein [Pseudomonadales bacterium]